MPIQCQAYIETPTNGHPLYEPVYKRWHCRRPSGHPLTRSEPDLTSGYYRRSIERGMHISDPLEADNDDTVTGVTWMDEAERCGYERADDRYTWMTPDEKAKELADLIFSHRAKLAKEHSSYCMKNGRAPRALAVPLKYEDIVAGSMFFGLPFVAVDTRHAHPIWI